MNLRSISLTIVKDRYNTLGLEITIATETEQTYFFATDQGLWPGLRLGAFPNPTPPTPAFTRERLVTLTHAQETQP